jgi:hypothetical protein
MDYDPKSLYKYITYIIGGAAAGVAGMYKLADYLASISEASKFIEYSLESIAVLSGLAGGMFLGGWYYDEGIRGVVNKFYPAAGAFLGARGGFELGELIAENLEFSTGASNALEWLVTLTGLTAGIVAGRKVRKTILDYNKKKKESTPKP